ncbi:hypothetical protein GOBAR_AA08224 [Gossypium barbadense]|uniref:Protein root UVB sensitive/RUS domain-containing protein n=1 Tax=Gossypium barbadense TaxID=3634 RepID=A0A2P5YA00_GOSBA|nr:hypothetical protein GOBAR_AA08224 [Gossypium barbadense]
MAMALLKIRAFLEKHDSTSNEFQGSNLSDPNLSWLPQVLKEFILPAGFPGSVSDDYLQYMLLQFPTNVTGWICHTLVTSSLLKACESNSGHYPYLGGRFGNLFDDDPKQWRMYADFIGSAGSIFDLTTQVYPAYFLPLASLGNLAKAVARGLKDPSFRVIQNHFAISGNLGEVSAKVIPVTRSYAKAHSNLVSESAVMGDEKTLTAKLEAFMEQMATRQQALEEQMAFGPKDNERGFRKK